MQRQVGGIWKRERRSRHRPRPVNATSCNGHARHAQGKCSCSVCRPSMQM